MVEVKAPSQPSTMTVREIVRLTYFSCAPYLSTPEPSRGNMATMTTDLWMLVATSAVCLLLPTVYLVGRLRVPGGLSWGTGNRSEPLNAAPWVHRAERAHVNILETLPVFAILVLVAHVSGKSNDITALGSQIYFGARVLHAIVYVVGIPFVRTLIFFASMAGLILILVQLF